MLVFQPIDHVSVSPTDGIGPQKDRGKLLPEDRAGYRLVQLIFKRENIPVRIVHKSYTLRQALSHNTTERKCNRPNCPIADTNLCLQRNTVYQLTCKACGEYYIGSTTRFLHDRTKEHLANDNSSVKKNPHNTPSQQQP